MEAVKSFFDKKHGSVMQRLRLDLNVKYLYHDCRHTEDVIRQVQEIGYRENVNQQEIALLKLAALYHDLGFLVQRVDHESAGVELFMQESVDSEISDEEKQMVASLIMVTKIPQQPKTLLESIICDADLDYLGREDFPSIAEFLYLELKACGEMNDRTRWNEIQLSFLGAHQYHTESSRKLRTNGLQNNIQFVRRRLASH
jgi:predicted metal-dependent HD superfamily phosphohydrolase